MLELLHQMSRGEGFGRIAGLSIRRMKKIGMDLPELLEVVEKHI